MILFQTMAPEKVTRAHYILNATLQTRVLITLNGNYTTSKEKIEKMLKLIEIVCLVKIIYITLSLIFWIFESQFSLKFLNYLNNFFNYPLCFV